MTRKMTPLDVEHHLHMVLTTVDRHFRTIGCMNAWRARLDVRWRDVALAALIAVLVALGTIHVDGEAGDRAGDAVAFVCGFVGATALAFWRRFALPMVVVVAVAVTVYHARDYSGGPALLPGPLSLLLLGYRERRRAVALAATACVASLVMVGSWIGDGGFQLSSVVATGWTFAAAFAGMLVATRGERAAAERERQALTQRQAIADERLRIARDLHDSVAHAMATINVQSGVAAHLLEREAGEQLPPQLANAREALAAIRAASSDVLDELGAILGALRQNGGAAPLDPVAGLDRIDELVARSRADGLRVECTVEGEAASVAPSLSAAAYRVVQEALSNTRRHAGADADAAVTIDVAAPGLLRVEIVDDGGLQFARAATDRANGSPGLGGMGLVGMRERVESTGGRLTTGPHGAGYRVLATWGQRGTDEESPGERGPS